jgi:hypothetical protein
MPVNNTHTNLLTSYFENYPHFTSFLPLQTTHTLINAVTVIASINKLVLGSATATDNAKYSMLSHNFTLFLHCYLFVHFYFYCYFLTLHSLRLYYGLYVCYVLMLTIFFNSVFMCSSSFALSFAFAL